jgi:hypothetical protein
VHTDNLIINDSTARKAIKGIAELLPHFDRKATTALIVKAVDSVDTRAFMITTQKKEIFWVLNLVGKKETDDFQ